MRVDVYLVEQGLETSRERARVAVLEGRVTVNGRPAKKPSAPVEEGDAVCIIPKAVDFVGRGGYKLQKAVEVFSLSLTDRVCMDIGASTGGFTQCMLREGARRVYAVDVGQNQLSESLRCDERVVCLENTDARALAAEQYPEVSFVSCDVSFISVTRLLPVIAALMGSTGEGVILIKPQFEAGRAAVGKGGIVRDKSVHARVIGEVVDAASALGIGVRGLTFSPVHSGNIEYLLWISGEKSGLLVNKPYILSVIEAARAHFSTGEEK